MTARAKASRNSRAGHPIASGNNASQGIIISDKIVPPRTSRAARESNSSTFWPKRRSSNTTCCALSLRRFQLKRSVDEGVTEQELEAIERWRELMLEVAPRKWAISFW